MRRFQRGNRCCAQAHTGVRRPPQRCSSRWIAALPVASTRNLLQRPRAPLQWARPDKRNLLHRSATMHRPPHRSTGSCTQRHLLQRSVCAAQRSLVRLTPISPHLRSGTALIAHHRTGLIQPTSATGPSPPSTHICNWTESIPRPPLPCERVHLLPTSAPQPNPSPADLCATTAALRDICLCATQA